MPTLDDKARRDFWSRPGTFAIFGSFEDKSKLSWYLLEHCTRNSIEAVPVNKELDEVLGQKAVVDPAEVSPLAGIVCVRTDPHATEAVRAGGRLKVPVWLSRGTASEDAVAAADEAGAELIAGSCPLMYLNQLSFPHNMHRFLARVFRSY